MKSLKYVLAAVTLSLIAACGPNLEDAKKLGFESVEQMKDLNSKGFKTRLEFDDKEAKSLGFTDASQRNYAKLVGVKTKAEFDVYIQESEAKKLGFIDSKQQSEAYARGYFNGKDYEKYFLLENIKVAKWINVFIENNYTEVKGGLEIEKNWFSNDRLVVTKGANYKSTERYFVDKNSIKKVNESIQEVMVANTKEGTLDIGLLFPKIYHFNCSENTYKGINSFEVESIKSSEIKEIDQSSGKTKTVIIPSSIKIIPHKGYFSGRWEILDDKEYYMLKYRDVACKLDFSVKEINKSPN